jgi:hypothetical protein
MRHFDAQEVMQITKIFKREIMLKLLQQISSDRGKRASNNDIINVNKEIKLLPSPFRNGRERYRPWTVKTRKIVTYH